MNSAMILSNLKATQVIFRSRTLTTRALSAVEKLKCVVEEYRVVNYAQEMPSRCKKDIVRAAELDSDGRIGIQGLETLMRNLSPKSPSPLSRHEIEVLMTEMNPSKKTLGTDEMLKLL